jgi:hypothetical protein
MKSGVQTRRSSSCVVKPAHRREGVDVEQRVPIDCTLHAHQSMRRGCTANSRTDVPGGRPALMDWTNWLYPGGEDRPTKKMTPITLGDRADDTPAPREAERPDHEQDGHPPAWLLGRPDDSPVGPGGRTLHGRGQPCAGAVSQTSKSRRAASPPRG